MNRRKTNTVTIGSLQLGSAFPVRVQSMTTTDTMDTEASVAQSVRMIEAGCELVRLTAPSIKEAKKMMLKVFEEFYTSEEMQKINIVLDVDPL